MDLESEIELEQLSLPISNTENKLLEAEVQRKQKEVASNEIKIDEHRNRIQSIGDHLKNVKQELHHTHVICTVIIVNFDHWLFHTAAPGIAGGKKERCGN